MFFNEYIFNRPNINILPNFYPEESTKVSSVSKNFQDSSSQSLDVCIEY